MDRAQPSLEASVDKLAETLRKNLKRPELKNGKTREKDWSAEDLKKVISDGVESGRKAVMVELMGSSLSEDLEETLATFFPNLVMQLLQPWPEAKAIADRDSVKSAVELSVRIITGSVLPKWFVSIGFGVSPDVDYSVRVAAYPAPIVTLLETVRDAPPIVANRISPTVRIFSGAMLRGLSGVELKQAIVHSLICFALVDAFLCEFKAPLLKHGPEITYELFRFSKPLQTQGRDLAAALRESDDEEARTIVKIATALGENHNATPEQATLYAAFHSFMFLDWPEHTRGAPPYGVVSYGGRPERNFNLARRLALRFAQNQTWPENEKILFPESIQVAADRRFEIAPYYVKSGELTTGSVPEPTEWKNAFQRLRDPGPKEQRNQLADDYELLVKLAGDEDKLQPFFARFSKEYPPAIALDHRSLAGKLLSTPIARRLEPGLREALGRVSDGADLEAIIGKRGLSIAGCA